LSPASLKISTSLICRLRPAVTVCRRCDTLAMMLILPTSGCAMKLPGSPQVEMQSRISVSSRP
jgi:hypothetical protein